MHSYKTKRLPKSTVEIIISIPKDDIKKEYDLAFAIIHKDLTVQGFRKGKVPHDIAKKNIKAEAVYQELVKSMLPRLYEEIVKKEELKPIISPRVELVKAKQEEDWEIKITLAERPAVNLGQYKESVNKVKATRKAANIWVPGKSDKQPVADEKQKMAERQKLINEILNSILKEVKVEISDLIIEEEISRRLTQLVDDVQKLGLSVDSYLKSKQMSLEDLKARYRKEIEDTYKIEFILTAIADSENITVTDKEYEQLFANIKDEKEKQAAQANAYFYASILRKQKTLDFLADL